MEIDGPRTFMGPVRFLNRLFVNGWNIKGAGTSFPGDPSTNDTFFRTDLGWLCYYDGTRWLTTWESSVFLSQTLYTANANPLVTVPRHDYAYYVSRVVHNTYVDTTNDETDYWIINTEGQNIAGGTTNLITTFNTSEDSPDTHTQHEGAADTPTPANTYRIQVSLLKNNSPGDIYFTSKVYYRLVVT
jgi:hypothetical protein